jgi:hypothetical protein
MKKSFVFLIVVLIILLVFPVYSLFKWTFQPKRPLKILILDKTVPTLERDKHRSFNWILTHNKYVKSNKRRYSYRKDYIGFFPLRPLREKQWDRKRIRRTEIINLADSLDMLYYTDTYGVYFNDWYKGISRSRRTRLIYGGLNNNDYLLLKEMRDRNKLILAEYNILDYPTSPLERNKTENLFGIYWTEWTGKYFESLDTLKNPDFPPWILKLYSTQYRREWSYKNSGIVFLKGNNRIVVLENETHLDFEVPYVISTKYGREKFNLPYKVNFPYWFDIIESGENNVISNFKIHTNEVGDSILDVNMIPKIFPAVIQQPGDNNYYYFAGDFATNPVNHKTAYFKGIEKLDFLLTKDTPGNGTRFYWNYYKPLITGILDDYYHKINP